MREIIVSPYSLGENDYIRLMIQTIERAGFEPVEQKNHRFTSDAIIYNWYENMDGKGIGMALKKMTMIYFYKLIGKKIIWVLHNKQPHNHASRYSNFMMKFLAKKCNRIMVLCDEGYEVVVNIVGNEEVRKKISKVPLVNYTSILREPSVKIKTDRMNLMMFGRIQPYKCLEVLIKAISECNCKDKVHLLIAGNAAGNKEYVQQLENMIQQDDRITIRAEFISLEELQNIVKDIDAFVLPMDLKSSLNSSAVVMAFSLARTVICPRIGTTQEYSDIDQFAYCYEFSTEEEHIKALQVEIEKLYEDYISCDDGLSLKGKQAWLNVNQSNSIDRVAKEFKNMMDSL